MKKLALFLWAAAILIIGLIFIQNQALYLTEQRLSLNLLLYDISLPPLHNGTIILIFFFSGALLSYASRFTDPFKARHALKKCKATGEGYLDKIGELKSQIDQMKSRGTPKGAGFKSSAMDTMPGADHKPA